MQRASLIVWDEAPVDRRYAFEAVDRTLKDILRFADVHCSAKTFGGKTFLLGGDFRQTLPVVQKGSREDIVHASINQSPLWTFCEVFTLTKNMRVRDSPSFSNWILALGDGKLPTIALEGEEEPTWIEVPDDLLIPPTGDPFSDKVSSTSPDLVQ